MYKQKKERHFLSHTIEHLLGVFVIVVGAATIGYFASAETASVTNLIAPPPLSTETLISASTGTTDSALTTGTPVSFSATPAPETDCSGSQPMTRVFLAVSTALGGSFEVTSDTGMSNARLEWGEYPLPNGKYMWRGVVNSGFTSSGEDSGTFELRGTCLSSLKNTNDWMTGVSPLDYPETSLVTPHVFLGTVPVVNGGTVSDTVGFVVTSLNASRAGFALVSSQFGVRFFGGDQGVTYDPALHTWKLNWKSASVQNGDYILVAIVDTGDGVLRSTKASFRVSNVTPLVSSGGTTSDVVVSTPTNTVTSTASSTALLAASPDTQILPRPLLKVFFDNKPVTDPSRMFDDEDIELRVIVSLAKKVNLVAIDNDTQVALQLGNGIIDDLLTIPGMDIWTYVWSAANAKEGSYKVFARVLRTDGTTVETMPVSLTIRRTSLPTAETEDIVALAPTVATPGERQQILDRVSDPANCTNEEECKIFCASYAEVKAECTQFARVSVGILEVTPPSFTDGVSDDQVSIMLTDVRKRPKELPEIIVSADDLRAYCAQSAHSDVCTKALLSNDLASLDALEQKKRDIARVRGEESALFTERVGARMFVDLDNDGITDYDEVNIYHTDPSDPDTDHDGFFDGAEILSGTNPRGSDNISALSTGTSSEETPRAGEEMGVENPLIAGALTPALLSIADVSVAEVGLNENGTTTAKKLKLSGHALPNSFVRIYIFSNPIVVTVKADESGAWTYTLDKELPDGTHQVVSAITDSGGRILAKSEPLPFVKEAAAVSLGAPLLPQAEEAPGFFSGASLYAFIAILIALLGLGLSVIGFMVYRKGDTSGSAPVS
jgi:hypothetical protein